MCRRCFPPHASVSEAMKTGQGWHGVGIRVGQKQVQKPTRQRTKGAQHRSQSCTPEPRWQRRASGQNRKPPRPHPSELCARAHDERLGTLTDGFGMGELMGPETAMDSSENNRSRQVYASPSNELLCSSKLLGSVLEKLRLVKRLTQGAACAAQLTGHPVNAGKAAGPNWGGAEDQLLPFNYFWLH